MAAADGHRKVRADRASQSTAVTRNCSDTLNRAGCVRTGQRVLTRLALVCHALRLGREHSDRIRCRLWSGSPARSRVGGRAAMRGALATYLPDRNGVVHIGSAHGKVAVYLTETEAYDLADLYGHGDSFSTEIIDAAIAAYPAIEVDEGA